MLLSSLPPSRLSGASDMTPLALFLAALWEPYPRTPPLPHCLPLCPGVSTTPVWFQFTPYPASLPLPICSLAPRQKLLSRCHMTTQAPQAQNFLPLTCFPTRQLPKLGPAICGISPPPPRPLQPLKIREAVPILLQVTSQICPALHPPITLRSTTRCIQWRKLFYETLRY